MLQERDEALGLVVIAAQATSVAVDTAFVLGRTYGGYPTVRSGDAFTGPDW